jgi:DNA-binding NarL/FixJ family response regulator
MFEKTKRTRRGKLGSPLSERELEILALIIEGLTNKEIAEKLSMKQVTVRTTVHHIQQKRGTASRMKLIIAELKERMRRSLLDPLPMGASK